MEGETTNGLGLAKVGILGPFGTYSHEAASKYFGSCVRYEEIETIKGVFDSLALGILDFGVIPQENSIFGIVLETYDALRSMDEAFIRGEVTLRIDHCLLVRAGVKLEDIRTVLSHEQALGQCMEFIRTYLPHASTEETTSTAAAAQALLERPLDCASISSRVCATLFEGLEVLKEAVQKEKVNYTRFYVLARNNHVKIPPAPTCSRRKALFRVSDNGTEVSLCSKANIMDVLRNIDTLDLTRIDRRPCLGGIPFRDTYFLEVQSPKEGGLPPSEVWKAILQIFVDKVQHLGMSISLSGNW